MKIEKNLNLVKEIKRESEFTLDIPEGIECQILFETTEDEQYSCVITLKYFHLIEPIYLQAWNEETKYLIKNAGINTRKKVLISEGKFIKEIFELQRFEVKNEISIRLKDKKEILYNEKFTFN